MKHPVPDRVKPSFVIFDIWALWRSALSVTVPWCQKSYGNGGRQRVKRTDGRMLLLVKTSHGLLLIPATNVNSILPQSASLFYRSLASFSILSSMDKTEPIIMYVNWRTLACYRRISALICHLRRSDISQQAWMYWSTGEQVSVFTYRADHLLVDSTA